MLRRLCGPTDSVITQSINTLRNFFPPGPTIKAFSSHLLQSPLSELAYGAVSFHAVPLLKLTILTFLNAGTSLSAHVSLEDTRKACHGMCVPDQVTLFDSVVWFFQVVDGYV